MYGVTPPSSPWREHQVPEAEPIGHYRADTLLDAPTHLRQLSDRAGLHDCSPALSLCITPGRYPPAPG